MRYQVIWSEWDNIWTIFDSHNEEPVKDYQNREEAYRICEKMNRR